MHLKIKGEPIIVLLLSSIFCNPSPFFFPFVLAHAHSSQRALPYTPSSSSSLALMARVQEKTEAEEKTGDNDSFYDFYY